MGISGECFTPIIGQIEENLFAGTKYLFTRYFHLQQSFFLTKIALKIFHKNCRIDFSVMFIWFQQLFLQVKMN